MAEAKIKAEPRTEFGKGAARRIRRADKVPAVLYGRGTDPVHITLPGHEAMLALKHGGANALMRVELGGKSQLALTKQVQADPIKGFLEHIDLVLVRAGEKVTVEVPVHLEGEAARETLVYTEHNTVTIEAEATHIPEYISVDIDGMEAGSRVTGGDLVLPPGSTLGFAPETLIVNVTGAPTEAEVEAELEEAEAEAGVQHDEPEGEAVPEIGEQAQREGGSSEEE